MKGQPIKIERLFQAAKGVPASLAEPMPALLKNRVLVGWTRESSPLTSALEMFSALRLVFRLGLGCALAVMLACVAWSYRDVAHEPETYVEAATLSAHLDLQL